MTEPYQPKMQWHPYNLGRHRQHGWSCTADGQPAGCVLKQDWVNLDTKWHWAGNVPHRLKGRPPVPNTGYEKTARLAVQKCEEYWDLCKKVMRE